MSSPKPVTRKRSSPRRILFWAIPIGLAWLGFRLFEPVLVWSREKLFKESPTTSILSHHGTAVGSTSYFAALPEFGLVISVIMNKGQENLEGLTQNATAVAEIFAAEVLRR